MPFKKTVSSPTELSRLYLLGQEGNENAVHYCCVTQTTQKTTVPPFFYCCEQDCCSNCVATAVVYRIIAQQWLVIQLLAQWSLPSTGCMYDNMLYHNQTVSDSNVTSYRISS
jgi:hypothetical protein